MKKFILIFTLVFTFFITDINVYAEEFSINVRNITFDDFYKKEVEFNNSNIRLYDYFMDIFNSQTKYKYYLIDYYSYSDEIFYNTHLFMFNDYELNLTTMAYLKANITFDGEIYGYHGDFYNHSIREYHDNIFGSSYSLIDSNLNMVLSGANYNITGLYDSTIKINSGDKIPSLKDLSNIEIRDKYINGLASYTEVNLDNYEYVILNLKDYSKKDAFETNLQVKGSIAITPIYEFGTVEKENITDLCNLSYSDFTYYRFFVLKNDLINNAIYIVKECSDSGSSFRFNSSVFDITYVTAENVDDPVVTFGGVDYHTIPFNKLSNTVNKNEEEGFIPGESGSSLTDIVDNITSYITSFWNSLSTFMGLVTKFFNTLPIEIRAISITTFATACTLGLLKILKS